MINQTAFGVFCIAFSSLLLELTLIRVFDVLWYPNMAYMVITLAIFSFGLAGVYLSLRPVSIEKSPHLFSIFAVLIAATALFIFPAINKLPFDYNQLVGKQAIYMLRNFFLIYVVICTPFFLAGFLLSSVFMHYASQIQRLYFWDLVGAAFGCVVLIPLLPQIGTVGVLFIVAGIALMASCCFSSVRFWKAASFALALVCLVIPFTWNKLVTFKPHMDKRAFISMQEVSEGTYWDPISKIDIIDAEEHGKKLSKHWPFKWIAYDGGSQTSYFYRFDGDFDKLRAGLPDNAKEHFWDRYLTLSHFIKADQGSEVLTIGSAGGQEIKAALTFNASHVDGIELVGKVVELGKTKYAEYTGNIMNLPNVTAQKGEGRSFLRSSDKKYDIIQINSNHTSSSIAAGSGAMQPAYLQTVEAYEEFFTHLNKDGILHINHHVYPKMVATAAAAWKKLGRSDFRAHVVVFELSGLQDNLPTFLVKMSPWTRDEVAKLQKYMGFFTLVVNPFDPQKSFLSDDFFTGDLPQVVVDMAPYRLNVPTDNQPFFNSLRKSLQTLPKEDGKTFLNSSISGLLNRQKNIGFPTDVIHLFVTSAAAVIFAIVFTFIPLMFAPSGKAAWEGKKSFLTYFSCLGLGFIIFELVFIQIFMKLIGYPLYTYTTVLFTFLFGAGLGSNFSEKLQIFEKDRAIVPFAGIVISTTILLFSQQILFDHFLQFSTVVRILFAITMILPLAFFLGMPFPLGILAIQNKPEGTVAWAWAFNGVFTVAGGIFCAIFSVYFGFQVTISIALTAYILAFFMYRNLYRYV